MIDYRVFSDQGLGTGEYVIVDSQATTPEYIVQALSPGTVYSFKVAARNTFGYSEESDSVSILAAQEPFQPSAPTTTRSGD